MPSCSALWIDCTSGKPLARLAMTAAAWLVMVAAAAAAVLQDIQEATTRQIPTLRSRHGCAQPCKPLSTSHVRMHGARFAAATPRAHQYPLTPTLL